MPLSHDIPANDNKELTGPELKAEALESIVSALDRAVELEVGPNATFAAAEQVSIQIGNEAQRVQLERRLQAISDAHGDELLIDGVLFRKHQDGTGNYPSLYGGLRIERPTFREPGVRNGPTKVPLELEAGIVEGATPAMAARIALGHAKKHSRDLEEDLASSGRVPPSRTKLESLGKAIGSAAKQTAPRIERYLRQTEEVPDDAVAISVGLDRTAVPMEELRDPHSPPKTRRKKRTKPYERSVPPPVDVNYRMAYVGTVSITDKGGESLVTRRYAATAGEGPEGILNRMKADVRNALQRNSSLAVGIVQDGAPEMWNLVRSMLETLHVEHLEAIDRYHLNGRLGKILKVLESEPAVRKSQLHIWNEELDHDDCAIDRIHQRVRDALSNWEDKTDPTYETLCDNDTFLDNNKDRMRYVALIEAGLPVGSGVTEGSCRSLVGERAKRASRRWHEEGLCAALALRGLYCSDRLFGFMRYLRRRYEAKIEVCQQVQEAAA